MKTLCRILSVSGLVILSLVQSTSSQQLDRDVVLDNKPKAIDKFYKVYGSMDVVKKEVVLLNKRIELELKRSKRPKNAETVLDIINEMPMDPYNKEGCGAILMFRMLDMYKDACEFCNFIYLLADYDVLVGDQHFLALDSPLGVFLADKLEERGKRARPTYADKFKAVQMDKRLTGAVDYLLREEVLEDLLGPDRDQNSVLQMKDTREKIEPLLSYGPERSVELCNEYVKHLMEIFYPAKLYLALDASKISEINPTGDKEFMDAWTKFHICSAIAADISMSYILKQ